MAWHTGTKQTTLKGAEAKLIRWSLGLMLTELEDEALLIPPEEQIRYGYSFFDDLAWEQRLALLFEVGSALVRPRVPMPQLTAVREAAVAAIYLRLAWDVANEIAWEKERPGRGDAYALRELIVEAAPEYAPKKTCRQAWRWAETVDLLSDNVLWDRDFEFDEFLDMPPDEAAAERARLLIDDEYYVDPAPDPTDAEIEVLWKRMRRLAKRFG